MSYERDEVVMHQGIAWRCALDPCPAGREPGDGDGAWERIGALPDDVRIEPGTALDAVGLDAALSR